MIPDIMRMVKRTTPSLLCFVFAGVCLMAQPTAKTASQLAHPIDATVQCDQKVFHATTERVYGPISTSAYGELRATEVIAKQRNDNQCKPKWLLHITRPAAKPLNLQIGETEDEWYYEYSLEIIGWSQDGKLLLAGIVMAAGDWDKSIPVVVDTATGKFWKVTIEPLFEKRLPANCLAYFNPTGFTPSGKVAFTAGPRENDLAEGEKPCIAEGLWELDYLQKTVKPLPKSTHIEHYGRVAAAH